MKQMKKMMDMMDEKRPSKMSANDLQAKKDVLMELLGMADEAMRGKSAKGMDELKGMKVSVMAKDPESMKKGLEKAEDLVKDRQDMEMEPENELAEDDPMEESKEDMTDPDSELSPESELDAKEASDKMIPEEDEEESFFGKRKKKHS